MAGDKMREDQLQAVWFAAGTAAFMACIERVVVVSIFAHWRVWAFLALNLLLLAILFTSKSQIPSNEIAQEDGDDDDSDFNRKKTRQDCRPLVSINDVSESVKKLPKRGDRVDNETKNAEDYGPQEAHDQLSKEELNQRVEAFIAMFRQHLVSDAKGKSLGLQYPSKRESVASGQVMSPGQRASFSQSNEYVSA